MTEAGPNAFRGTAETQRFDRYTRATLDAIAKWEATPGTVDVTPPETAARLREIVADPEAYLQKHGSTVFAGRPSLASYVLGYVERAQIDNEQKARAAAMQATRAVRRAKTEAIVAEAKDIRAALGMTMDELASVINVGGRPANGGRIRSFEAKILTPEESTKWLVAYRGAAKMRGVELPDVR
jgi:hypothetical protein